MTCASDSDIERVDVSTLKLFLITYLIGKVDVVLALIPMEKSFVFPTTVSSAGTCQVLYLHSIRVCKICQKLTKTYIYLT
jgi:hypothetical protein